MGVRHAVPPQEKAAGIGAPTALLGQKEYCVVDVGADAGVWLGNAVPRPTSADDELRGGDKPDPVVAVLEPAST